ncbi:MAG: hypothetical protein FJZ96_01485 [Chloroflexi bacterium]|nr:hypothetical protein [Chloroflexota bacterium]
MSSRREIVKGLLGELPFTVEMYWLLRQRNRPFQGHYNLERLRRELPPACAQVEPMARSARRGRQVFVFSTLHYWVEQTTMMSLALAGLGDQVTLMYLPYSNFKRPISAFDRRRQNLYSREMLSPVAGLIRPISMLDVRQAPGLPEELELAVRQVSLLDCQYTLQSEEVDLGSELHAMRLERNTLAARAALGWLRTHRPEVVVIPNGTILELGIVYRVARYLELPVVTYEFNDQPGQIWIAQDDEIMRQNTDPLWQAGGATPLTADQHQRIHRLEKARKDARSFGRSDRLWQNAPTQGADKLRAALGLDGRPVALLATNVLGDSLTLSRNIFAASMSEWLTRSLQYFAGRRDVQLIVRIHPGECYLRGQSMLEVAQKALPELPENIRLIKPLEELNTYDLMEVTSLGLVYTTTTGLEMAMAGIPVIVSGETHYRQRGFTLDPQTWDEYHSLLEGILAAPASHRLSQSQVDLAWNYAYRFFFQFPRPFPWRLISFWKDYPQWPVGRVLGEEGRALFEATLHQLTGDPIEWTDYHQ